MAQRRGTIYSEWQRNTGKRDSSGLGSVRYVKGVGRVACGRLRWVAEITVDRRRYRFRSTNFNNCRHWIDMMLDKYPNYNPGKNGTRS